MGLLRFSTCSSSTTLPSSSTSIFKVMCWCNKQNRRGVSSIIKTNSDHPFILNLTNTNTNTPLIPSYSQNRLAQSLCDYILNPCFLPDIDFISDLIYTYCKIGRPHQVLTLLHQLTLREGSPFIPHIYPLALSCLGSHGELQIMDNLLTYMLSTGFPLDFSTGNVVTIYHSLYGSITDMEYAYTRLKKSRILLNQDCIRAISFSYIKRNKFYNLGDFIRGVGLGRRDVGNLLWNLLLLSYAANFKMKSLQREFLRMLEAGFLPDITTFNIRALAFSKMSLFWDLHLSLEHMKCQQVVPDLVTYGSVVDAYLDRRLGRNLDFALSLMNVHDSPRVSTDPIVFQVLGKGDFHASSEAFLEFKSRKKWTYKDLIGIYVKKKYRSNQIFWNY